MFQTLGQCDPVVPRHASDFGGVCPGAQGGAAADARRTGGDRPHGPVPGRTAGVPLHIGRRSGGDVQLFRLAGGAKQRDGGLFGQFAADLRSGHVRTYQTVGTGHAAPFDARLTERGVAAAPLLQGAARRGVGAGCGIGKGGPVSPPPKSVL